MPWKTLVVGVSAGYLLALSSIPRDLLAVVAQLPQTNNKISIAVVAACIIAIYAVFILLPLNFCANRERSSYTETDPAHTTSFRANLKRRGSLGHLEYLQPALRSHLLAHTARQFRGAEPPASARSTPDAGQSHTAAGAAEHDGRGPAVDGDSGASSAAASSADVSGEVAGAPPGVHLSPTKPRRSRRARIASGDDLG